MSEVSVPFDARRARRIHARIPVSLIETSIAGKVEYAAAMLDLSELGMRVHADVALSPGQQIEVRLSRQPEPCRVAWVGPKGSLRQSQVGLEFTSPLPGSA